MRYTDPIWTYSLKQYPLKIDIHTDILTVLNQFKFPPGVPMEKHEKVVCLYCKDW